MDEIDEIDEIRFYFPKIMRFILTDLFTRLSRDAKRKQKTTTNKLIKRLERKDEILEIIQ